MPPLRIIASILTISLATPAVAEPNASMRPRVSSVSSPERRKEIITALESGLRHIGSSAKVERCDSIMEFVQQEPSGKDSSWAAVCRVSIGAVTHSLLACNDELVGKFTVTENVITSATAIEQFIAVNCPPGG